MILLLRSKTFSCIILSRIILLYDDQLSFGVKFFLGGNEIENVDVHSVTKKIFCRINFEYSDNVHDSHSDTFFVQNVRYLRDPSNVPKI